MSIEVRNISFSYRTRPLCRKESEREKKVLDGFSSVFEHGRITALTGPNGAGKSTLAGIIMGIITPDEGSVLVDGENIKDWSLAERGRVIGYAMQNPSKQIFNETVAEEVEFGLLNLGLSHEDARKTALEYIEMFGLSEHVEDFPFSLSHGEKQRLVLCSILAMKPRYLILDEPTAGLDLKHKEVLGRLLTHIAKPGTDKNCSGCGIAVISHDRRFIEEYCDGEVSLNEKS